MPIFGGGSPKIPEPKPTPQEESLAEVAVAEYFDYARYYRPLESKSRRKAEALQSPALLNFGIQQQQARATTRFRGGGFSPGSLESRLLEHQSEMQLKSSQGRKMAIMDHLHKYSDEILQQVGVGRALERSIDSSILSRARSQDRLDAAEDQAKGIRQAGLYGALGQLAGYGLGHYLGR